MEFLSECATTVEFPVELPAVRRGDHWLARSGDVQLRLTNLNKVFWPEAGYTKGDLVTYYFNVSPTILPHVENRPLTLKRMPDGLVGPYFYGKDAPSYTPSWMSTLSIQAARERRTIRFLAVRDVATMLWVANLGCIEFHVHHTRGSIQEWPSYAAFDLDPFHPAGLADVKHVATLIRSLLDQLGLESYPKTSGAMGMQIFVPLDGGHNYEQVRRFVAACCELVHGADRDATTLEWEVSKRAGRVFLDANINRAGASIAAAYSLRARWGAPVSTPFAWDELEHIEPYDFTITTMLDRIADVGDLFMPVASATGQSLSGPMSALGISPR